MINAQELGRRIADARQRTAMTQAALAEQLHVARTTVVAMEKGSRRPSDDELLELSRILGVSLHDLVKPLYVHSEVMTRFRSVAAAIASPVDAAVRQLEQFGRQYVELERLLGIAPATAPLADLATFRAGDRIERSSKEARRAGQQAARAVRALLGLGDAPIADLEAILEMEAGLRIFHLRGLPKAVSALLVWGEGIGACVGLHAQQPRERRRWSLAHEFGHFLRDREAGDLLPTAGPGRMDPSEHFSEGCASELLLPATGVSRHFDERRRANGGRFLIADIIEMRHHFDVSFQAMTLRLEELDRLAPGTYQRIREGSFAQQEVEQQLGYGGEAFQPPAIVPARYQELVLAALDEALISETEASRYLEVPRVQVRALLQQTTEQRGDDGRVLALSPATAVCPRQRRKRVPIVSSEGAP